MTPKQQKAVEWICKEVIKNDGYGERYEYKRFEVVEYTDYPYSEDSPMVYVVTDVGLVGDEGTMAEVFARVHRHIRVGPRGGLKLMNPGRYSKGQGKIVERKTPITGREVVWRMTW